MKKTLLIISLITIVMFSCVALTVFTASAAPEGTPIKSFAEFELMYPTGTYYLANDIDFGGKEYEICILPEFGGTLDGNGYKIFNFKITNNGAESDIGIFLRLNKSGAVIIKNLDIGTAEAPVEFFTTASGKSSGVIAGAQENANNALIENVKIYANVRAETAGKCKVAGFIGYSRLVTIKDCEMNGSVLVGQAPDLASTVYQNAGGFIAAANADLSLLENCVNNAEITTYCTSVEARAAGLVTYSGNMISFKNCTNNGNITVMDTETQKADSQVAGIIAHMNKTTATLEGCTNNGKITGSNWVGGMVANVSFCVIFEDCINNGEYSKDAAKFDGMAANVAETAIVDYTNCMDKTLPIEMQTTVAQETTVAPAETTAPTTTAAKEATTAAATTKAPSADTTAKSADATTKAPGAKNDGCGKSSAYIAVVQFVLIAGAAFGFAAFKKK